MFFCGVYFNSTIPVWASLKFKEKRGEFLSSPEYDLLSDNKYTKTINFIRDLESGDDQEYQILIAFFEDLEHMLHPKSELLETYNDKNKRYKLYKLFQKKSEDILKNFWSGDSNDSKKSIFRDFIENLIENYIESGNDQDKIESGNDQDKIESGNDQDKIFYKFFTKLKDKGFQKIISENIENINAKNLLDWILDYIIQEMFKKISQHRLKKFKKKREYFLRYFSPDNNTVKKEIRHFIRNFQPNDYQEYQILIDFFDEWEKENDELRDELIDKMIYHKDFELKKKISEHQLKKFLKDFELVTDESEYIKDIRKKINKYDTSTSKIGDLEYFFNNENFPDVPNILIKINEGITPIFTTIKDNNGNEIQFEDLPKETQAKDLYIYKTESLGLFDASMKLFTIKNIYEREIPNNLNSFISAIKRMDANRTNELKLALLTTVNAEISPEQALIILFSQPNFENSIPQNVKNFVTQYKKENASKLNKEQKAVKLIESIKTRADELIDKNPYYKKEIFRIKDLSIDEDARATFFNYAENGDWYIIRKVESGYEIYKYKSQKQK